MLQIVSPCPSVYPAVQVIIGSFAILGSVRDLSFIPFVGGKYVYSFAAEAILLPLAEIDVPVSAFINASTASHVANHFALVRRPVLKFLLYDVRKEVPVLIVNILLQKGLENVALFLFQF